jgi:hypothetical protein
MRYCPSFIPSTFEPTPPSHPASFIYSTDGPLLINSRETFRNHSNCQIDGVNNQDVYINSNPSTGRVGIGLYLDSPPTHKLHVAGQTRIEELLNSIAANKLVIANSQGVLGSRDFTGNVNDVLRGDATFGPANGNDPNAWKLTGNAITAGNFLGTTNAQALNLRTNNATRLTIHQDGAVWAPGGTGGVPTTGAGTRMMWVPSRGAFRAGNVDGADFDLINIGENSAAFGRNVRASGAQSFAAGFNSTATAINSYSIGSTNQSTGNQSITFGSQNQSSGQEAIGIGNSNNNAATQSVLVGTSNTAISGISNGYAFGRFLRPSASNTVLLGSGLEQVPSQFVNNLSGTVMLGAGVAGANPAITILPNSNSGLTPGLVGVGTTNPLQQLHVNGNMNVQATTQGYMIANTTVLRVPGTRNILVGHSAGAANHTATDNVIVGNAAGTSTTTGGQNVMVGQRAGRTVTTGYNNTILGYRAAEADVLTYNGVENTIVGAHAGSGLTGGSHNTLLGIFAGNDWNNNNVNPTGTYNTLLGSTTTCANNVNNATAVGGAARVTASNTVALGRAGDANGNGGDVTVCGYTEMPVAAGGGLIGTAKGINRLGVNGNILMAGRLFQASDSRVKRNFTKLEGALEKLEALKPLVYEYDTTVSLATSQKFMQADSAGRSKEVRVKHAFPRGPQMGFLAQDVAKVIPEAVQLGTDTSIAFMDQTALIPLLTQALKEEHAMVQNQQQQLKALEEKLDRLEKALAVCCAAQGLGKTEARPIGIQSVEPATELATETGADAPKLEQNSPNPFNSETEIRYYVPSKATQALLLVTDAQGRVVLSRLASTGAGSWRIAAQTLQVGVYHYTLVVDGRTIATRKMVIVN